MKVIAYIHGKQYLLMAPSLFRVASIDVFRASTMLLMIFVNDLWTLHGIPYWLEHAPADVDFLGVADVVFPCFLFILGMAIPFALEKRLYKGESRPAIVRHVLVRSIALLVMGLFTVNAPEIHEEATGLRAEWYVILMVTAFFLIWNVYPDTARWPGFLFTGMRWLGVGVLLWLAVIFRAEGEAGELTGFSTRWWGILGLIGWSYLVCALIWLWGSGRSWVVLAGWTFFTVFNIAAHAGWLTALVPNGPQQWFVGNGAFHSFTLAGMTGALLLKTYNHSGKYYRLIAILMACSLLLLLAGIFARQYFIISKIQATPAWVLLCSGIAFACFALLYWLVDRRGKGEWFSLIKPAGTHTLTCYLIPYYYYSLAALAGLLLPAAWITGAAGLLKSFLFSLLIIGITAALSRCHIRLKL